MKTIDKQALEKLRTSGKNPLLVNVLPRDHFEQGHIPDSRSIPLASDDFEQHVEKAAGDKGRDVVVYCANEQCDLSPQAAKRLEKAGFENVHDFTGGMEAWKQAGQPVSTGAAS